MKYPCEQVACSEGKPSEPVAPKCPSSHLWHWAMALPRLWLCFPVYKFGIIMTASISFFSMHHQGFPYSECPLDNVKAGSELTLFNPVVPIMNLSLVLINRAHFLPTVFLFQSVPSPATLGKLLVCSVSLGLWLSHLFCLSFLSLSPWVISLHPHCYTVRSISIYLCAPPLVRLRRWVMTHRDDT